jgi:hypothetical protein
MLRQRHFIGLRGRKVLVVYVLIIDSGRSSMSYIYLPFHTITTPHILSTRRLT